MKCKACGKIFTQRRSKYFQRIYFELGCCIECFNENPDLIPEIREKGLTDRWSIWREINPELSRCTKQ